MKNILILLTVLLLPLTADGQDKPSFSAREMADVRVTTPGLFAKSNHIYPVSYTHLTLPTNSRV